MNNGENNVIEDQTPSINSSLFINNELLQNPNQVADLSLEQNDTSQVEQVDNPDLEKTVVMSPILDTNAANQQQSSLDQIPFIMPEIKPLSETAPVVEQTVITPEINPLPEVAPVVEQPAITPEIEIVPEVAPVVEQVENNPVPNLLMSAVDSSQIPQIDPTIPVIGNEIENEIIQSNLETKVPDLLFSSNPQPEQPPITPIPMDDNQLPNINRDNTSYQQSINQELDDDRLFRAFVGEKYYEVGRHRFFNIWGFIFNGLYLIYRKMYLLGIIVLVAQLLLSKFLNQILVSIILGTAVGLFFNIIYTMYANMKINGIKKRYGGGSLIDICRRKGGTSIGNTILLFIMYATVVTILTFVLGMKTIVSTVMDSLKINFNLNIVGTVTTEYDEQVEYYIGKFKFFMKNTDPEAGYEPEISNKELLKVVMPRAKQENDFVSCTLDNRQEGWRNTVGYLFKPGSTDCKSYMQNAEEYIGDTMPLPDSIVIMFNSKKELGPGTKLDYKDSSCMYNDQKQKFECHKK